MAARPPAQVLYSPRALPPRRPAGMSLPFSSHIWVSGTRAPSPSRFTAWVPARVPRADQRRSGLAQAQVTRAEPYMERLPAGRPLPTPPSCPAESLGCGEGHRVRGVPSAPAPRAAPVRRRRPAPPPAAGRALGLREVRPAFHPFFGFFAQTPEPQVRLQGGGSRVQVVGPRGPGEQSHPRPGQGRRATPPASSPANLVSPPTPSSSNPEG